MKMKPGDEYKCPKCGQNTFLRKEAVMEGWTKKGDILKCASCGAFVCDFQKEEKPADPLKTSAADKFKSLLGADEFEKKPTLSAGNGEDRFCKDCAYLIPHPFVMRCSKFGKDVNPMDDCPEFKRRETLEKKQ